MTHKAIKTVAAIAMALAAELPTAQAAGDDSKGGANAYQAFLAILTTMTSSSNPVVQNDRNAGRLLKIRQELTKTLIDAIESPAPVPGAGPVPSKGFLASATAIDAKYLLCNFRSDTIEVVKPLSGRDPAASVTVDHLAVVGAEDELTWVLNTLKGLTPPKATDIPGAVAQLFRTYDIKGGPQSVNIDKTAVQKVCSADLMEFDAAYYGQVIRFPKTTPPAVSQATSGGVAGLPSLSFLGPIGSAFDLVAGVIAPVFIDFTNMAAQEQQKAAVKEFLDKNKTKLEKQGDALGRTMSNYLFAQRLSLAGQFAEQVAAVRATQIDLKKLDACAVPATEMAQRSDGGAPSAAFMLCYREIWSQYSKMVDDALKTANAYDALADAGNTNTALAKYMEIFSKYDEVVQWSGGNDDIWASVNQAIVFAGAIANATSESNLAAIRKALGAIH